MTYEQATLSIADDAAWMFIWTDLSKNVGIVHIDKWGDINGHKTLPRDRAKDLYMSLLAKGAKIAPDHSHLSDYRMTIDWLLRRI